MSSEHKDFCLTPSIGHFTDKICIDDLFSIVELPNFEYRKVLLTGVWDHTHSFLLGPKSRENVPGYNLITPLIRPSGSSAILVNRGFVSSDLIKSHPDLLTKESGVTDALGLLRSSQVKNRFTPDNKPENGEWYWADVDAMAEYAGGEAAGVQPVYVEAVFGALLFPFSWSS